MKIGLIADPHANLSGTQAVLAQLRDCAVVLCAGDLTGYFNLVNETIELLRCNRVLCVRGNHDQFLFGSVPPADPRIEKSVSFTREVISQGNLAFLSDLPYQLVLVWDRMKILMCHGSPWNLLDEYVYPDRATFDDFLSLDADVIVLGHTHWPMVKRIGNKLIVNPGSCGQPRNGTRDASCAILDTETLGVQLLQVPFDLEATCLAVVRAGLLSPYRRPLLSGDLERGRP